VDSSNRQREIAAETLSILRKQIEQQRTADLATVGLQLKVATHTIEDWLKRIGSVALPQLRTRSGFSLPTSASQRNVRTRLTQLLREVEGRAPDRTELQLGEGSAARGGADRAWAQTRSASQAATATAFAGHATAASHTSARPETSGAHWATPQAGEAVDPVTQVGRALRELGIQMIPAYSPQARGRSERNFSTWQGRLPQELRLAGCTTLEAANRFLREHYIAEFNRRFQVKPEQAGSAFVPCRKADLSRQHREL
jgi:hypothetical protein